MRIFALLSFAAALWADPGWGLVEDARGHIYFGDVLRNVVWRIAPGGALTAIAQGRHAHALCIDEQGVLWGDHTDYDATSGKFTRGAWRLEGERAVMAELPRGRCQSLHAPRPRLSLSVPRQPDWEPWAARRSGGGWLLLEHAPAARFERLLREKKPTSRVRRVSAAGVSRVLAER